MEEKGTSKTPSKDRFGRREEIGEQLMHHKLKNSVNHLSSKVGQGKADRSVSVEDNPENSVSIETEALSEKSETDTEGSEYPDQIDPEILIIKEGERTIEVIPIDEVKEGQVHDFTELRNTVNQIQAASYVDVEGFEESPKSIISQVHQVVEGEIMGDPGDPPLVKTSGWYLEMGLNGEKMVWNVDPGSCQTIVPTKIYYQMSPEKRPKIYEIGTRLLHAGGSEISQLGRGVMTITIGGGGL